MFKLNSLSKLKSTHEKFGSIQKLQGEIIKHDNEPKTGARPPAPIALDESVSLLASTLELTADGILVVDNNRKIVFYNQKFLDLWSISQDLIERRDDLEVIEFVKNQLKNSDQFAQTIERVYADASAECAETLELADNRIYERYCRRQLFGNKQIGHVWSFRDVTARETAQADLRRNEELFRTLIENAEDLITIFNRDWTIRYESPAVEKVLGFKPKELRGRGLLNLVHPEDRGDTVRAMRYKIAHPGEVIRLKVRLRHKNGLYRMLSGSSVNLLDNPAVAGIVANTRDVTEREEIARSLKISEERYRAIFDKDLAANSISTTDGRLLDCNESYWRGFGFESKQAALETNLNRLFRSQAERDELINLIRQQRAVKALELQMLRIDGAPLTVVLNAVGVFDERGEMIELHGHGFDITEQKRTRAALDESEQMLRQSQKLEAVGQLAGGIAHDFNNLLTAILGYSEMLLERFETDDEAREKIRQIKRAGERAADLTKQLLVFSRKQILQPAVLDLNQVVTGTSQLLQRLIGENIRIELRLDAALEPIEADRGQIEQVIINLAVNARDAMPGGGTLLIETNNALFAESAERIAALPIQYVLLTISDTGAGMTADVQARAFEPFFTTKEVGKGTGLGLSTVYGIVKQSGGFMRLDSEIGVGSVFKIYLPRAAANAAANDSAKTNETTLENDLRHGTETILIAEDESVLREMTSEMLEASGYHVLTAANGDEALRVANDYSAPIHLLISDMIMPGMNGGQLAEQLRGARPETKIIYVSGYTEQTVLQQYAFAGNFTFIQKPFSLNELLKSVRETLDADKTVDG